MKLRRLEWMLAMVATLLLVLLHIFFISHAGGLWRDEVNTVAVSTIPGFRVFLHWLDFDSFPILWLLIMRAWHAVGFGSDLSLRILGCAVGLCLLGALWLNARAFSVEFPFFSLLLLGFNPSIIRYGDSLRAYGLGMCMVVLSFATIWRVIQKPSVRNAVWACAIALLSVQTLYYNSFLLLAVCTGGMAVCLRRRWWRRIALLLGIGALAAMSVTVYIPVFRHSKNWSPLFKTPGLGAAWYWQKFSESVSPPGFLSVWIWVAVFVVVLVLGAVSFLPGTRRFALANQQQDIALFSAVAVSVGAAVYYFFLHRLSYITQPWYYLAYMALFGVAADCSLSLVASRYAIRIARLALLVVLVAVSLPAVIANVRTRMTNLDLVAAEVARQAGKDDMVLVSVWHNGVTFNRYYRGAARWETLPPIDDHRFHRPDLLLPYMTAADQRASLNLLYDQIQNTLAGGHRVWLVGALNFLKPGEEPLVLPPAPNSTIGWQLGGYQLSWSTQAGEFLQTHALQGDVLPAPTAQPVSDYENSQLMVLSGWQ
jgi:hypothetical protein